MFRQINEMMAMGGPPLGNFNVQLRCYSAAMFPGGNEQKVTELNNGGKILMPPSALDWLTRLHIAYPMLFKLTNPNPGAQRVTHCGVLEFLAEEGKCHLPYWMMRHLLLEEGQIVQIEYVNLPVATYAKFKPQHVGFMDIHDPKVVLEMKLRSFSCLTKGDIIALEYNQKIFELLVLEVKPGNAVSIVETDMNTEFDAPEGYVEPQRPIPKQNTSLASGSHHESGVEIIDDIPGGFLPFTGEGQRLDGKVMTKEQESKQVSHKLMRGTPDYDWKPGRLTFVREYTRMDVVEQGRLAAEAAKSSGSNFEAFKGSGAALKPRKPR